MRFPSNKTLAKICIYGSFATITGVMYMRYKLEDRVRKSDFYRLALTTLRQNKGAVNLLGEPIKELGFNLSDGEKNQANAQRAQFEIKVKGSKDRGKLFFWASHSQEKQWLLDRLELEIDSQPDKRFLIIKAFEKNEFSAAESNEYNEKEIK